MRLILVLMMAFGFAQAHAQTMTASDVEAFLDGLVPLQLKSEDIAGAVIVVVKDGRILFAKGYGYSDVAKRTPVTPDATLFRPGSISKLFTWTQGPAAVACVGDLEALPGFLLENDTGARDHLAQFGQHHFDNALAKAKNAALQIRGNASCTPVISEYLRAWRRGHLAVEATTATPVAAAPEQSAEDVAAQHLKSAPTIEILSTKTIYLTLKNFEPTTVMI